MVTLVAATIGIGCWEPNILTTFEDPSVMSSGSIGLVRKDWISRRWRWRSQRSEQTGFGIHASTEPMNEPSTLERGTGGAA